MIGSGRGLSKLFFRQKLPLQSNVPYSCWSFYKFKYDQKELKKINKEYSKIPSGDKTIHQIRTKSVLQKAWGGNVPEIEIKIAVIESYNQALKQK